MIQHKPLILIIDDEPAILSTLAEALKDESFLVETLADGSKALESIGALVPDLVLLDIFLPQYNGIELLKRIKKEYPAQQVIMISGFGTIQIALDAIKNGALDFIEKPLNLDEVLTKIAFLHKPVAPATLTEQSPKPIEAQHDFVGASTLFCELLAHAQLIAPLQTPVFIYGHSGSGKSLLAKYVHDHGKQAQQPFITIDCAEAKLPMQGATQQNGTLFLKNIHELSPTDQKQVLALINQENSSLRIIASGSVNLFALVQQNRFNQSLFCKLNATPIEIPSINKRRYDIPLLVNYFLQQVNSELQKHISVSPEAMRFLRNYPWTGDVAHIKTIIAAATKNASDPARLEPRDFYQLLPERCVTFVPEQSYSRFASLDQATHDFQKNYLIHMLKKYRYNTDQLADYLQIPANQLHHKMSELQINHTD